MGMKYTITERTLRKAVRDSLTRSNSKGWTINEGFIESFFNALADNLGAIKQKYDDQQRVETEAKMTERHMDLIRAVLAAMKAKNVKRDYNDPGYITDHAGFRNFNWKDQEVANVVFEVLANRLSRSTNEAVAQIRRVSQLPAIPGLSVDGKSPQTRKDDPNVQQKSIETAAQEQVDVIKQATKAVTQPIADIGTVLEGIPEVYQELGQLISRGGFGSTAVDFVHKMKYLDVIVSKADYGSRFSPRLREIIEPACKAISQAGDEGVVNYGKQGNYKSGIAFNALPSESLQSAAAAKAESGGEKKAEPAKK